MVRYRSQAVDGFTVFYREAGDPTAPTVLLLHGFPTSSHMFRNLLPLLAERYHVVAPDLPGFGFSGAPDAGLGPVTFERLADVIERFTEALGLERFALYVFDYGAPVGLRLALRHPERITALVSQNGNAYLEGLAGGWNPIQRYWSDPSPANRDALRGFLSADATRDQYTYGVSDPERLAPEAWTLDAALLQRPGIAELQLDLFLDYRSNVDLYPAFQEYIRRHRPPILAIWGRHDPFFLPAGAEAFRRDQPEAEIRFLEAGHFALETHAEEIGGHMTQFLDRVLAGAAPGAAR